MFCGLTFTKVSWSLPFAQNVWQWHIFVLIGILSGFRDTRRSIMEPGFSQLSNLPFSEKGYNLLSRTVFSISSLRILCIFIYPSQKNTLILILNLFCSKTGEEFTDYGLENGLGGCMEMVVIRASTACHEHDKRLHLGTFKYMLKYISRLLFT